MTDRRTLILGSTGAAALSLLSSQNALAQGNASKPLVVAFNQEPDSIDLTTSRSLTTSRGIMENVTEALVGQGPDGQLIPTVATWRVMSDARVFEFQVKPGIKFHNGDLLTARDIEFSHQRMLKTSPRYRNTLRALDRVEVLSDSVIRFFFKEPTLSFVTVRPLFVVSRNHFAKDEAEAVRNPIGTGPYRYVGRVLGQSIDLEAFDGFREPRPRPQKVQIRIVKEDTTRVSMLRAGEVDLIVGVPYSLTGGLETSNIRVVRQEIPQTITLQFNFANPRNPWTDVRVRRAIAHAIDTDAIVKSLLRGAATRHARLAPQDLGFDPALKPYRFDPAQSRKLLAEAGLTRGFDLPMTYWANATPGIKETAEAVALYLKAVGINVKVEGRDAAAIAEFVRNNRLDPNASFALLAPLAITSQVDPAEWLAYYLGSKNGLAVYKNPQFDAAIEKAVSVSDLVERAQLTKAAVQIAHDDVADVPLWTNVLVYAMKPTLDYTPVKKSVYSLDLASVKQRAVR
jgi:peptide/nickel transport system substrate-binding protein